MKLAKLVANTPQLARGQVWCRSCGSTLSVRSAEVMRGRGGWPKCCGYTMTIDSPEEQKRLAEVHAEHRANLERL